MKRQRKKSSQRLSKDATRLIQMASDSVRSGCRVENRYWDTQLETLAMQLLDAGNDSAIETALDFTYESEPDAHDVLAESVEAASESCFFYVDGSHYQALLVSVPLIAWSKYPMAAGQLRAAGVALIEDGLRKYVFAPDTQCAVNPFLYSIDHLPQSFSETRKLLQFLADAVVNKDILSTKASKIVTIDMPADTRMLLAVVIAPLGMPIFRWQEGWQNERPAAPAKVAAKASTKTRAKTLATAPAKASKKAIAVQNDVAVSRNDCLVDWVEHTKPELAKLIPGASLECGLPDAFFRNCRECDRRVRPYMVTSAVDHLETALSTTADQLHAIIAGVGEAQVDEYRVAFALKNSGEVVNGMIWPLVSQEDDDANPGPREEIEAILKAAKVGKITKLPGVLPPEFCDDCGAPLFYDADAEAVHPHMPDDSNLSPAHYH